MNQKSAFIAAVQLSEKMAIRTGNSSLSVLLVGNIFLEVKDLKMQKYGKGIPLSNRHTNNLQNNTVVLLKQSKEG